MTERKHWTSKVWLAWGDFFYEKKPRYGCSICGSVFESQLTPNRCPNGHKAEDDPKHELLTHKEHQGAIFPFSPLAVTRTERCPGCKKYINYSLIQSSPHPDAEGCCYDCLPADMQIAYDRFFGHEPKRADDQPKFHFENRREPAIDENGKQDFFE